jgi:hypothetical protein
MPSTDTTTIKVPKALRERISLDAAKEGVSAAQLIATMLAERERGARFRAVRAAYETADDAYRAETDEWDSLAGDGFDE